MPAAALQAQQGKASLNSKLSPLSLYVSGGVSGYNGYRNTPYADYRKAAAPDVAVGAKWNLRPWGRVGLNVGYTKVKTLNNTIEGAAEPDYQHLEPSVQQTTLSNRLDSHILMTDVNFDFNLLSTVSQRWGLWLGSGIGYMHLWTRNTTLTAYSEETIDKGPDHFNVYTHDYITTQAANRHANSVYIPLRLSVEYNVMPHITLGIKGEYRFITEPSIVSPLAIYSVGGVIAYNL